jgi:sugar phosphate isomerase/epimerase
MSEPNPVLAVSTGPLWRLPLDDAFRVIKAAGAEGVEVMVNPSPETQSGPAIERAAERHDLPVVAVHAPMLLLTRRVFTTDPIEKVRRTLELCRNLDTKVVVLHPPYAWQVRYQLWALHELEDELAGHDTLVTMENMYPVHIGRRRMTFHRYGDLDSLKRFKHVTLDTSHLAVAQHDLVEAYDRLRDRVVHIHLSDNRGKGRDSHAPLGAGILPLEDFVRNLDPSRLRSIALEVNPGPAAEDLGKIETIFGESLDAVRAQLPSVGERGV